LITFLFCGQDGSSLGDRGTLTATQSDGSDGPSFQFCNFSSCFVSGLGCAIDLSGTEADALVKFCIIEKCSGTSLLYSGRSVSPQIFACGFSGNTINEGGACVRIRGILNFTDCIFGDSAPVYDRTTDSWSVSFTRSWFAGEAPDADLIDCQTRTITESYSWVGCVTFLCPHDKLVLPSPEPEASPSRDFSLSLFLIPSSIILATISLPKSDSARNSADFLSPNVFPSHLVTFSSQFKLSNSLRSSLIVSVSDLYRPSVYHNPSSSILNSAALIESGRFQGFESTIALKDSEILIESLSLLLSNPIGFPSSNSLSDSENPLKSFNFCLSNDVIESLSLLLSVTFSSHGFTGLTEFPSSSAFIKSKNPPKSFSFWISDSVDESLPLLPSLIFVSVPLDSSASFPSLSRDFCDSSVTQSQRQSASIIFIESIGFSMTDRFENSVKGIAATSAAVEQNVATSFIYSTGFWLMIAGCILVVFGVIIAAVLIIRSRKALQEAKYAAADEEMDDTTSFLNSLKRENALFMNLECMNPLSGSDEEGLVTIEYDDLVSTQVGLVDADEDLNDESDDI
jgi:hypothetical protein